MVLVRTKTMLGLLATLALRAVNAHSDGVCDGACDESAVPYACLMQKTFTRSKAAAPLGSPSSFSDHLEMEESSSLMQVIPMDRLGADAPEPASDDSAFLMQAPVTLEDLEIMMGAKVEAPQAQAVSSKEPEELVAWTKSSPDANSLLAEASEDENPEGAVVDIRLNSELQESATEVVKRQSALLQVPTPDTDAPEEFAASKEEPLSFAQSSAGESWGWLEAMHLHREARRHREPTGTLTQAMVLGFGFVIVGLVGAAVLGMMIRLLMFRSSCDKKEESAALRRPAAA